MFSFFKTPAPATSQSDALVAAISKAQAIIWFDPDGTIRDANDLFLKATGYDRAEILGQHHRMFMPTGQAEHRDYQQFWADLRAGKALSGTFQRCAKGGSTIWLEASYNPLPGPDGRIAGFVKFATDVTPRINQALEAQGVRDTIDRSQAVIEFDPSGKILHANDNFLRTMGYSLTEVVGRHHSMFLIDGTSDDPDYRDFWARLRAGEFHSGEFCRRTKAGQRVWLQATYSAIRGHDGQVAKVIKVASDVTAGKRAALEVAGKMAALERSQAMIEFDPQGRILWANRNFLDVMGYRLDEIVGRYHSIFMPEGEADRPAYAAFWSDLREGKFSRSEFQRKARDGRVVWIMATYTPILDADGKVYKIAKFATDITARKAGLAAISVALDRLSAGDLTCRITEAVGEELEPVKADLNSSIDRLAELLGQVSRNAQTVREVTTRIDRAAAELSSRTDRQAHTLDRASQALRLMAGTTDETRARTAGASDLAATAKRDADSTSGVVMDAVQAMAKIAESSSQISRIIGVIDEIAFQTNLLALNAGVEAARAGDAGRGFAVVASEVRALAQRSSVAAKEIATLIGLSAEQVRTGEALVNQAGESISAIQGAITDFHHRMLELADVAADQSRRLEDVAGAVRDSDQVTQSNAAMVQETADTTAAMSQAAEVLLTCIQGFRLADATQPALRRAS
ncbi:methyl-accepting chemotaxis protein [Tabrizicola aquatica]|uniref:methyl-accepting chemotaxis protein n=1 Tax=Tabrizicola aquatica TaxID=909926 RepID=UPI000CCFFE77|nr:PAS domain S-box protein [Tabrizicola aquatica]